MNKRIKKEAAEQEFKKGDLVCDNSSIGIVIKGDYKLKHHKSYCYVDVWDIKTQKIINYSIYYLQRMKHKEKR